MKKLLAVLIAAVMVVGMMPVTYVMAEESTYPGDIRWDFAADNEGFAVNTQGKIAEVADGAMKVIATGADPNITVSGQNIDLSQYDYIRVRAKDTTANASMDFYLFDAAGKFYHVQLLTDKTADSDFTDYVFDLFNKLDGAIDKDSIITKVRFDFMNNMYNDTDGAVQYIDSIVFSKYDAPQTSEAVSDVKIGGVSVSDFDSAGEYCETTIDYTAYNEMTTDNIELTMAEGYETASVVKTIKTVTGKKYVDITVNTGDASRSYRIACTPEISTYPGDIRWDFAADSEGFTANARAEIVEVKDGILTARATGTTNQNHSIELSGLNLDLSEYNYIRIRMKNTTSSGEEVVYLQDTNNQYHQAKVATDGAADTDFVDYVMPLSDTIKNNTLNYKFLRFDFIINIAGDAALAYIDSIVISKNDAPQTSEAISEVKIGGVSVSEFNPAGEYCDAVIDYAAYNELTADSIELTMAEGYESAYVTKTIKNVTGKKYVDITVNTGDDSRSYRIACTQKVNTYPGDIRWDFAADSEGFSANANAEIVEVKDGVLTARAIGTNNLNHSLELSGLNLDLSEYNYIRVRMRNTTASTEEVIYLQDTNNQYHQAKAATDGAADADFVDYVMPLSDTIKNNTLKYKYLRFDFIINIAGEAALAHIDSIVISKYNAPQTAAMISAVSVGDTELSAFKSNEEYMKIEMPYSVYASAAAENISATVADEYADYALSPTVKVTELLGKKYIDIAVNSNNTLYNSRNYRIECVAADFESAITNQDYDETAKTLTVGISLRNNTEEAVNAVAVVGVYSADKVLKSVYPYAGSFANGETTDSIVFTEYTYEEGDTVKLFFWDGLISIKPLTEGTEAAVTGNAAVDGE